ncbi:MAG: FKBP-type peptidyl-prolyl cis-trans isomerase [Clostridia bacterium]|nr:FKBP-type peptidyl-prolyl cis-trans isomerase [Clostridia bacterium]
MKTKALSFVLAMCMLVTVFAGCSKGPYDYKFDEYIKLGNYNGVTIDLSDIREEIKSQFETAAKDAVETKTYSKKEEGIAVEKGDVANIDYVGKVDGKEFEGGKDKGYDLTIGSGTFIDGFEDGLIGAAVGETLDVKVTFPENYGAEGTTQGALNGKEAVFTVTVNSIKRSVYPVYNDKNVETYTDYKTVAEFEESIRENIEKNLFWEKFYEDCKIVKYPEKELRKYYDEMVESYTASAASLGVTLTSYVVSYMGYSNISTFFSYLASVAQSQVKQELIVYSMLDALPILNLTEKEYNEKAEQLWKDYCEDEQYTGDYKQFLKDYDRETIEMSLYYERIIGYIKSSGSINDDVTKNGLVKDKVGTRYYINDVMQTGWMNLDVTGDGKEDKCYFDTKTGYLAVNGSYVTEGDTQVFYEFTKDGVFVGVYNGFFNNGQTIRYFKSGVAQKGWQTIEGSKYYFFETTYAAVGDVMVKDENGEDMLGRFTAEGKFERDLMGWVTTEEGTRYYYTKADGTITFATREYELDGYTFYFGGKDGYMAEPKNGEFVDGDVFAAIYEKMYLFYKVTVDGETRYAIKSDFSGKYETAEGTYYFVEGVGQFGWQSIGGDMYFFSSKDGKMLTGEQKISDVTYVFDSNGKLTTKLNGLVYDDASNLMYFVESVAQTGLQTVDGNKYFFSQSGLAVLGWIDADGDGNADYYSKDYKLVVSQTATIDGKAYVFDADGHFTVKAD